MNLQRRLLTLLCLLVVTAAASLTAGAVGRIVTVKSPPVVVLEMHDTLQPKRADVFIDLLQRAQDNHAAAILVDLSSPGGLSQSADRMVAAMRRSTVPIIVWVGGRNHRVGGQALRLLAEADVALMARDNLLSPIWSQLPRRLSPEARQEGSVKLATMLNQSLEQHGRKQDAVEELSTGIHWFTPTEALQSGFIDGIAEKQVDVLRFVSDHGYNRGGVHQALDLTNAHVYWDSPSPQADMMLALMNPNLCVLIFTLALLLLYLEVNTPGVVLPGAIGILLLLLSMYSLSRLPLSGTGILLCAGAILLFFLEAQMRRHGFLATAGVVLLVLGLGLLVKGPIPQLQVAWGTAIGAGVGFGGVTACLLVLGLEARRTKVRTGSDAMLGWLGVAQTSLAPEGRILVRGELWHARLTSQDGAVAAGDHVKVLRADGLTLEVTAVPLASPGAAMLEH